MNSDTLSRWMQTIKSARIHFAHADCDCINVTHRCEAFSDARLDHVSDLEEIESELRNAYLDAVRAEARVL